MSTSDQLLPAAEKIFAGVYPQAATTFRASGSVYLFNSNQARQLQYGTNEDGAEVLLNERAILSKAKTIPLEDFAVLCSLGIARWIDEDRKIGLATISGYMLGRSDFSQLPGAVAAIGKKEKPVREGARKRKWAPMAISRMDFTKQKHPDIPFNLQAPDTKPGEPEPSKDSPVYVGLHATRQDDGTLREDGTMRYYAKSPDGEVPTWAQRWDYPWIKRQGSPPFIGNLPMRRGWRGYLSEENEKKAVREFYSYDGPVQCPILDHPFPAIPDAVEQMKRQPIEPCSCFTDISSLRPGPEWFSIAVSQCYETQRFKENKCILPGALHGHVWGLGQCKLYPVHRCAMLDGHEGDCRCCCGAENIQHDWIPEGIGVMRVTAEGVRVDANLRYRRCTRCVMGEKHHNGAHDDAGPGAALIVTGVMLHDSLLEPIHDMMKVMSSGRAGADAMDVNSGFAAAHSFTGEHIQPHWAKGEECPDGYIDAQTLGRPLVAMGRAKEPNPSSRTVGAIRTFLSELKRSGDSSKEAIAGYFLQRLKVQRRRLYFEDNSATAATWIVDDGRQWWIVSQNEVETHDRLAVTTRWQPTRALADRPAPVVKVGEKPVPIGEIIASHYAARARQVAYREQIAKWREYVGVDKPGAELDAMIATAQRMRINLKNLAMMVDEVNSMTRLLSAAIAMKDGGHDPEIRSVKRNTSAQPEPLLPSGIITGHSRESLVPIASIFSAYSPDLKIKERKPTRLPQSHPTGEPLDVYAAAARLGMTPEQLDTKAAMLRRDTDRYLAVCAEAAQ